MAPLSGTAGSVVLYDASAGTAAIVGMSEWSISLSNNVVETTAFGDQWVDRISGIKDWSLSFSGNRDTDTSQTTLINAALAGSVVGFRTYQSATGYWSGSVILDSMEPSIAHDGKSDISFGGSGKGALTNA